DWKKLLNKKQKGMELAQIHLDSDKAKKSWKYFNSKKYRKKARHLRDFMVEYAKDSGNVPACN
ncbi:cytochrome C, partial [Campylobacterota bacterium]